MRRALALLGPLLALAACTTSPPVPPPAVDPTSLRHPPAGDVVGFVGDHGSHVWLGLPYAMPPTGERRWRSPEPAPRWDGTREATAFGAVCPQIVSRFGGVAGDPGTVAGDEDCLRLNVYAPRVAGAEAATRGAGRPVMVWIHGGGNVVGHASLYDGGNLAATRDVVVVTANYRLGPFGWFRHPALRAPDASPEDASGNYGTLDLVRMLEWVRDNIAAFGGDPGNVTIFGESAGGRNVVTLLLAPKAAGLFHRAVVQSGRADLGSVASAESAVDDAVAGPGSGLVAQRLLVARNEARSTEEAAARLAAMDPAAVALRLRWAKPEVLLGLYRPRPDVELIAVPQVFADGVVLPDAAPRARFAAGRWNRVPVVLGTNRDEQKLFMFASPAWVQQWLWFLPRMRDPVRYALFAEHLSRLWKAHGADEPAAAMRAGGHGDVWLYRFDWDEEPTLLGSDMAAMLGAAHAFEIPFVFGHWDLGPEVARLFTDDNAAGRAALANEMMTAWASFARAGRPADWPRAPALTVLDTPAGGGVRTETPALLTEEAVLAAAAADPRIAGPPERCALLRDLVAVASRHDADDLARVAGPDCAPAS